ncbi:MAG TPA: uroporphyrinogen-III C-methyltransferase, partial [Actinobacteria bacterium]|nr:uroporphyrinogen-III C-methyltransferase [Actinomycetota bacterium]
AAAIRDAIADQLKDGSLPVRRVRPADGHVVLIGGGPGDPDLITIRGRRALAMADVVVFDRLGPTVLLETLADDVELVEAGKGPGHHSMTQDEINRVIVEQARLGKRVVRLKGGDPFVFGRGSEEVQACVAAGVTVEVIPGISSAVAGPAAAGIPVTHRGLANGYAVITGHQLQDLTPLAQMQLTLVVLMGVATLPGLVNGLVEAGKLESTPVAVIEKASTKDQRVTIGTLASIVKRAAEVGVRNPAVIVIGDVVTVPNLLAAESSLHQFSG